MADTKQYSNHFKYFTPTNLELRSSEVALPDNQVRPESSTPRKLDIDEYDRSAKKSWATPTISFDD